MDAWTRVFFADLDHLGEEQVRARLAKGFYFDPERREAAFAWLQQKETARAEELERRSAQREAALVEHSARAVDAAERAVKTAEKPNVRASIAIMIAVTAAIISMLSLLAHFFR